MCTGYRVFGVGGWVTRCVRLWRANCLQVVIFGAQFGRSNDGTIRNYRK